MNTRLVTLEGPDLMSLAALLAWLLSTLGIAHAPTLAAPRTAVVEFASERTTLSASAATTTKASPAIGGGGPVQKKKK